MIEAFERLCRYRRRIFTFTCYMLEEIKNLQTVSSAILTFLFLVYFLEVLGNAARKNPNMTVKQFLDTAIQVFIERNMHVSLMKAIRTKYIG